MAEGRNKKADSTIRNNTLRQLGNLCVVFVVLRPAAFRPAFSGSLAFHGYDLTYITI